MANLHSLRTRPPPAGRRRLLVEQLENRSLLAANLTIDDAPAVVEGNAGTRDLVFTVALSEPVAQPVTVEYATADGTAKGLVVDQIASGLARPVFLTTPPGDMNRLFVLEQHLRNIRILDRSTNPPTLLPTPFLTLPSAVSTGNEQGLLGLAFHPNYATNGFFYVNYTDTTGTTQVRRFTRSAADPNVADPASELPVLSFSQPQTNHNGGWLGFGPDGFLYIASGDGGNFDDQGTGHTDGIGNGQDKESLLGKMLRIDVNGDDFPGNTFPDTAKNYAIPPSNPFAGDIAGADEIWSYGLRNPWRPSFDRQTGDLWIADVGQNAREEIDFQPAASTGGENYGWRLREGTIPTPTGGVGGDKPDGAIDPIYNYTRGNNAAQFQGFSVSGGYVYRGPIPELQGQYFFGDYVSEGIWSLRFTGGSPETFNGTQFTNRTDWTTLFNPETGRNINAIASFGEDPAGNLFIVDLLGEIYQVVSGADFDQKSGQLTFNPGGSLSQTITIKVIGDTLDEPTQDFFINLSNIQGGDATITDAQGIGTIQDDDPCGLVVTNTSDAGPGSLREAINCANNIENIDRTGDGVADPDLIVFNIPGSGVHTISPASALPIINDPVIIDGYTQPGAKPNSLAVGNDAVLKIELSGASATGNPFGLRIFSNANGSTIRGLVINRFGDDGIQLRGSDNNLIVGNFIGTDASGTLPRGNAKSGIEVQGGDHNVIGGILPEARNLVSANLGHGIHIVEFGTNTVPSSNKIQGNHIGTDAAGSTIDPDGIPESGDEMGNRLHGVQISDGVLNLIGGGLAGTGNVIGGNNDGIHLSNNNTVQGNFIGANPLGAKIGNFGAGINSFDGGVIGGPFPGEGNVAGNNGSVGIAAANAGTIQGNFVGTNPAGENLANGGDGIAITGTGNRVGGTPHGAGNVIANNAGKAVNIYETSHGPPLRNSVLGNSTFANAFGIDLQNNGFTDNDEADVDAGPNNLQNFPEIAAATRGAGMLRVSYTVPSDPANVTYPIRVEFFKADAIGEGQTYLGFDTFTDADFAAGSKTVTIALSAPLVKDDKLVATATDSRIGGGVANTSEFSPSVAIANPWHNIANPLDVNGGPNNAPDESISPGDALAIINYINGFGSGEVPADAAIGLPFGFLDPTDDNNVAPNDALEIINAINAGESESAVGNALRGVPSHKAATSGRGLHSAGSVSPDPSPDLLTLLALDTATHAPRRRK